MSGLKLFICLYYSTSIIKRQLYGVCDVVTPDFTKSIRLNCNEGNDTFITLGPTARPRTLFGERGLAMLDDQSIVAIVVASAAAPTLLTWRSLLRTTPAPVRGKACTAPVCESRRYSTFAAPESACALMMVGFSRLVS